MSQERSKNNSASFEQNKADAGPGKIKVPSISLPKGGGAISGLSDSFSPNAFTGTGNYTLTFPVTPARGLEPELTLNYNSGNGNSEFGLGFSLTVSSISRATNKQIPKYSDIDFYILGREGELAKTGQRTTTEGWIVNMFSPRIQYLPSLIEQWVNPASGESYWKVTTPQNITTIYGRTKQARIANPSDTLQVFKWLPEETHDAKGNKIIFEYKEENADKVPNAVFENNRCITANRYLSRIRYGNFYNADNAETFAFEVVFDYGEYDLSSMDKPGCDPYKPVWEWDCRRDPFSFYKSGFEIRTFRLCKNILLFHNFEAETAGYCLVKRLALDYSNVQRYGDTDVTGMSLLDKMVLTGYRKKENGAYDNQAVPATILTYSEFTPPPAPRFGTLETPANNLPGYLNPGGFLPVDLNGDGLPGLLYTDNSTALYFEPLGNGKYAAPSSCSPFPVSKNLAGGELSLQDIDSNGQLQLVVSKPPQAGYYQKHNGGGWENFSPFSSYPTDASNPMVETSDMDANGKSDLLMVDRDNLLVYFSNGKKGYNAAQRILNENGIPLIKQGYRCELVTFVDIFGDGLQHRVKITNGSVECWPCLGYGRYGPKITLGNAPFFEGDFDNRRIFLADIDGSGTADIAYVYADRVKVFLNRNGNFFTDPIEIILPDTWSEISQVSFADILGNGTSCLVLTKTEPVPVHYYYNFCGNIKLSDGSPTAVLKPYLLTGVCNNLGLKKEIQYCSSVKFALEDKLAGTPWATCLRFPVQVVEKVTITDEISGSRFVNKFKYHEGYYDQVEREFRGFGFVEAWDSETFEEFKKSVTNPDFPVNRLNAELFVPPVYSKTWFHLGDYIGNGTISRQYKEFYFSGDKEAYDLPDSVLENKIYHEGYETIREAYVALAGRQLRKEVYADDNTPLAKTPYTVEEGNYGVLLIHTKQDKDSYAVFQVNPHENIQYNYERNAGDPLVKQEFVFETDRLSGQVKKSCNIFLPRRSSSNPQIKIYPEQLVTRGSATIDEYINTQNIEIDGYWRGVSCETQEFELLNFLSDGERYFSFDTAKKQLDTAMNTIVPYGENPVPDKLQAFQVSWSRVYFWDKEQSDALTNGFISKRGLLHHEEKAVFTNAFLSEIYDGRLTNQIIESKGGYCYDKDSGYWWNKGLIQYYFLSVNPERFFMPYVTESPTLFNKTTAEYDYYYISPVRINQYVDELTKNTTTSEIDYITNKTRKLIDFNNNTTELLYDPLGHVIVTTIFGKERGAKIGGMTLYHNGQIKPEYKLPSNASFIDVLNNPHNYLQGASTYFYYDLDAWSKTPKQPTNFIKLTRNNFWISPSKDDSPYCKTEIQFTNGLGEILEKKVKADSGVSFIRSINGNLERDKNGNPVEAQTDDRWQVSGRTVYNNKNNPVEQYLPYYINTPYYEDQEDIPCPPPKVTHYDPLERIIRIDTPKGFFTKTVYTPWQVTHYDENDTVIDSPYFLSHYPDKLSPNELDAIKKAIACFNTPGIKVNNNKGNIFLKIQNNLGNVTADIFKDAAKGTTITPEEVLQALISRGYCIKDTSHTPFQFIWLTDKFRPYTKGFELDLGDQYKPELIKKIVAVLIQNELTSIYYTDSLGRIIESIDPRLYYSNITNKKKYYNFRYKYPMGEKEPVLTNSVDAGAKKILNSIFGKQTWGWSPRSYCQLIEYDGLKRKKFLSIKKISQAGPINNYSDFSLAEELTYGEIVINAQDKNLRGELYQLYDLSGYTINSQYSILGEVLDVSRQLVKDYKTEINWKTAEPDKVLDKEIYSSSFYYNAVKQLIKEQSPDKSITTNTYNEAGELYSVKVLFADQEEQLIIDWIEYDAKGLRTKIKYGNNAISTYGYEPNTLRLTSITSTRPVAPTLNTNIQNIEYWYDPVGNITRTYDTTIDDVYHNNQKVQPLLDNTYDPIYRLIVANGRQHIGISSTTYKNNSSEGDFKQCIYGPPPSTTDAGKLENYWEYYTYDDSGNLVNKKHTADSTGTWNVPTPVLDYSNQLKNTSYDESGNMTKLMINSDVGLSFNGFEHLVKAGIITRPDELDDNDYYLYNTKGKRTRKVSERMANGGAVTLIEDKIYIGNYEIKRNYTGSAEDPTTLTFERQTLRVMDGNTCAVIIHYITTDKIHPEKEKTRQCRFQMSNDLSSISVELDASANLISYEEYYPYGGTAIITGSNQSEVKLKDYRYTGKERDDSTGLYYYGARYYVPWFGRWLTADPTGPHNTLNLYTYITDDPTTYIDPTGETREELEAKFGAAKIKALAKQMDAAYDMIDAKTADNMDKITSQMEGEVAQGNKDYKMAVLQRFLGQWEPLLMLNFHYNPILADLWADSMAKITDPHLRDPLTLYTMARGHFTGLIKSQYPEFDYSYFKKSPEIHHAAYKKHYPESALDPSNLWLFTRGGSAEYGQHEAFHAMTAAGSSDIYNVIPDQSARALRRQREDMDELGTATQRKELHQRMRAQFQRVNQGSSSKQKWAFGYK